MSHCPAVDPVLCCRARAGFFDISATYSSALLATLLFTLGFILTIDLVKRDCTALSDLLSPLPGRSCWAT